MPTKGVIPTVQTPMLLIQFTTLPGVDSLNKMERKFYLRRGRKLKELKITIRKTLRMLKLLKLIRSMDHNLQKSSLGLILRRAKREFLIRNLKNDVINSY